MKSNTRLHHIIHTMFLIFGFMLLNANANADLLPDFRISAINAPAQATGGDRVAVNVTVVNQGSAASAPAPVGFYHSYNSQIDQDDALLAYVMLPPLAAGQSVTVVIEGVLPINEYISNYHIGAYVDYPGTVTESDNGNNAIASAIVITGSVCAVDGFENDDSLAQAKQIYLGDRQFRNFCEDDSDWMVFDAVAGKTYYINGGDRNFGDNPAVVLDLYDAAGNRLLTSGIQIYPKLTFVAPANGQYFIKNFSYMNKTGLDTQYLLQLLDDSPDLITNYMQFYATSQLPGGIIELTDTVTNNSTNDSEAFEVGYYLSTDNQVSNADTLLGTRSIERLASYTNSQAIPASVFSLPLDLAPGTYYFAAIADHDNQVAEYRETNNKSYSYTEYGSYPMEVVAPRCAADVFENDDSPSVASTMVPGNSQTHNHCDDNADWIAFSAVTGASYIVETSSLGQRAASILELFDTDGRTRLAYQQADTASTGDDHTARIVWQAPADGVYYIKASNNSYYPYIGVNTEYTIELLDKQSMADLKIHSTSSGTYEVVAGGAGGLWLEVYNQGYGDAPASEVGVYLSNDWNVTRDDMLLRQRSVPALGPGLSKRDIYPSYSYPATLPPGTYFVAAIADNTDQVAELSELNNAMRPLVVNLAPPPCAPDAYEEDDTYYAARVMALGVAEQHNHCDDSIDYLFLDVATGARYVFDTTDLGVNQDTSMKLYKDDGSFVTFDYDSGVDPRAARLDLYLFPGQYYLEVRGNRGVGTEYTFTATRPGKVRGKGKNK